MSMSDTGLAPVLTAPKRLPRMSTAPRPGVTARLTGVLDGRDRGRVEQTVARWCQVAPMVRHAGQAHLDLTEVTQLEPAGLDMLNAAYARLNAAGWRFRVTPPIDLEPRLAFNGAAIRRELLWG
jgi:anti-anti-sigma regulatory factor